MTARGGQPTLICEAGDTETQALSGGSCIEIPHTVDCLQVGTLYPHYTLIIPPLYTHIIPTLYPHYTPSTRAGGAECDPHAAAVLPPGRGPGLQRGLPQEPRQVSHHRVRHIGQRLASFINTLR